MLNILFYSNVVFLVTFRFHHQRVPLVILVCGTACVGKSTIATQLAQRLNLPNVLQVLSYICRDSLPLSHSYITLFWLYNYAF
jgi:pantothenate kinase-related protein Tda10